MSRGMLRTAFTFVAMMMWAASAYAQTPPPASPTPVFQDQADVIATTPLPGVGLTADEIAAPVQLSSSSDITASGALDLASFLERRLSGVHVNEVQGNPFQPDVNYRGYTASPLLGTPQGLSVYMDGVRLNQPFGEVVSWDLVPRLAIATTTLMPGSNPLFGLNTLGGALSIQTKDGRSSPGTAIEGTYGSFARRTAAFEHGGSKGGLDWYLTSQISKDPGWREKSPSDVRQFFGKGGWRDSRTAVALTVSYANNALVGNGLQDFRLLASDYASVYTSPDDTDNRSTFVNLTGRHAASAHVSMAGNAYVRNVRTNTLNADINEDSLDQSLYQPTAAERAALAAAGYTNVPASGASAATMPFPSLRCIANVLLNDDPAEKCNGIINTTATSQRSFGAAGQLNATGSIGRVRHQLTAGAAFDASRIDFRQATQLGDLNPDRTVTGLQAFGDGGITGGTVDGEPYDTRVDLAGRVHTISAYMSDTASFGHRWHVTASARYNRTPLHNRDRIEPGGGSGSLDTDAVFERVNPAAGVTSNLTPWLNAYASYSEGSRAPTSIELGCADAASPCKLPNAFAGDPPLDQVVTRTLEAGVRGIAGGRLTWTASAFRAENRNDILFVSSTATGFGYFKNFGRTRRQGIELDATAKLGRLDVGANYTFLNATYRTSETVNGSGNSTNDDDAIEIEPGDRLPLVPSQMLKAFGELRATSRLTLDVSVSATSATYARGNENNQHAPDGVFFLGSGRADTFAVADAGVRYQVTPHLQVAVHADNLFDTHYFTAAQLGPAGFTPQGTFIARALPSANGEFPVPQTTFYAPGAPRLLSVSTRLTF